eukprot:COSAG02_NODE_6891_length_3305_cov_2.754523_6_plen_55_part_01
MPDERRVADDSRSRGAGSQELCAVDEDDASCGGSSGRRGDRPHCDLVLLAGALGE